MVFIHPWFLTTGPSKGMSVIHRLSQTSEFRSVPRKYV
jgi:hypothetical protein